MALMLTLATLTATACVAAFAPAVWVADCIAASSVLRLLFVQGTVWEGSAALALAQGNEVHLLPGRIDWRFTAGDHWREPLALELRHAGVDEALRVIMAPGALRIAAGSGRVPASILEALGAPFNTVRPGGDLVLRWSDVRISKDGPRGRLQVRWNDARSALSPVAPLGDYVLSAHAADTGGNATLTTVGGVLLLDGRGTMDRSVMRFEGRARAAHSANESLGALLGVLGKRKGDDVLLEWEIRR